MIFLLMVRWPEQVALDGHTTHFASTIPCFTEYSSAVLSTADVRIMMIECLLT